MSDGTDPDTAASLTEDADVEFRREDLKYRRWLVFVGIIVVTAALTGMAWFIAGAPSCENPDNNWMPCWTMP